MFEFQIPIRILESHAPRGSSDPDGEYRKLGRVMAKRILDAVPIGPDASIIDVGCGAGRVAMGLAELAPHPFRYLGFDIRLRDTGFAREHITREFPDMQFVHLDFVNDRYNPRGRIKGEEHYYFPAPSRSFDVAIATSFFTHVGTVMARRCLAELRRTLKPGGQAFLTFFVLGEHGTKGIDSKRTFIEQFEPSVWTGDPANPLQSLAFEQGLLLELFEQARLSVMRFIPGTWRGKSGDSFDARLSPDPSAAAAIGSSQDIVIVRA